MYQVPWKWMEERLKNFNYVIDELSPRDPWCKKCTDLMCSWQPLQYVTSAFGNDCLHHIKITRDKISKRPFSYSGKSLLFSKIRAGCASSCNNDTIWEKFEHCFIARMMMISQNCGANISELSHKGTPLPPSLQFKYIKYIVEIYQIYRNISKGTPSPHSTRFLEFM